MPAPRKTYAILGTLLVACWFLAGVGGDRTPKDGGLYTVGMVFWVGFNMVLLSTLGYTLALGIRALIRHRSVA